MYELFWKLFFGAGILTTIIAFWGPEPLEMVVSGLLNLFIWIVLGNGATDLTVINQGQVIVAPGSLAVAILCWLLALSSLVPIFLGIYEWWTESEGADQTPSTDQLMEDLQ